MNVLSKEKILLLLGGLVEGTSIRSLERMTGVHRDTIMRWGVRAGVAAKKIHDTHVQHVKSSFVQADELWSFIGKKDSGFEFRGMMTPNYQGEAWVYVALDADSKLILSYLVGFRGVEGCRALLNDVQRRVDGPFQLTTDGFVGYPYAVAGTSHVASYGQAVKIFSGEVMVGMHTRAVTGAPNLERISTSHVERSNLTTRMSVRRVTRKTSAFSKKLENHCAALDLHFAHYNFCRWHRTLKTTPAMAAGITNHPWTMEEVVGKALNTFNGGASGMPHCGA